MALTLGALLLLALPQADALAQGADTPGAAAGAALRSAGSASRRASANSSLSASISGEPAMLEYWITSHSVAVVVPRPQHLRPLLPHPRDTSGEFMSIEGLSALADSPTRDLPWWWLMAVAVQGASSSEGTMNASEIFKHLPWVDVSRAFIREFGFNGAQQTRSRSARRGLDLRTVIVPSERGDIFFRAYSQAQCLNETSPPPGSLLPSSLPPLRETQCILELGHLNRDTHYHIALYEISNGTAPPTSAFHAEEDAYFHTTATVKPWPRKLCLAIAVVATTLIGLSLEIYKFCNLQKSVRESPLEYGYSSISVVNASALSSGSSQPRLSARQRTHSMIRLGTGTGPSEDKPEQDFFLRILKDLARSLTMFMPIFGPLGLMIASDVVIGTRIQSVSITFWRFQEVREARGPLLHAYLDLFRDVFTLCVNLVMLPLNTYNVQVLWLQFGGIWTRELKLDLNLDLSYMDHQRQYELWQELSGLEIVGWVPVIMVSTLVLVVSLQDNQINLDLLRERMRCEAFIKKLPRGKVLYKQLCEMDNAVFGIEDRPPEKLLTRGLRLGLSIFFGLVPHIWMCTMHRAAWLAWPESFVTSLYLLNIGGTSVRFLVRAAEVEYHYTCHVRQLAMFQALSRQQQQSNQIDLSRPVFEPFRTRPEAVHEARKALRDNPQGRIVPLNLEDLEDSKVWWHLREMVLTDIQQGRVSAELLLLVSIIFCFGLVGISSLTAQVTHGVTSSTVVNAIAMFGMVRFIYVVLTCARDINLMANEHCCLLHYVVAEMNLPMSIQRPLDQHLQQERFLLQVATLIEKMPQPQAIAYFAVTPQKVSVILGGLGFISLFMIRIFTMNFVSSGTK
jgi:hypothetical protein